MSKCETTVTSLIGEEVIFVDEGGEPICAGVIVAVNLGGYTIFTARTIDGPSMSNPEQTKVAGTIEGWSDWRHIKLAKYFAKDKT